MVSLKYLSNFWRTIEMPLINCDSNFLILLLNDTKLYVSVVTSSTRENIKLPKQLESDIKRTINWNKYLANTSNWA